MRKIIILFLLLSSITLTVFFVLRANRERNERKEVYAQVPSFSLPSIDNDIITEQNLQKDTPVLFVFFEPRCSSCDIVMAGINLRKDEFSAFQVVFFSMYSPELIRAYLNEIDFSPAENMFFLADENAELLTAMDVKSSPAVFIYNSEGVLIKEFNGFVRTETILQHLSNAL